MGGGGLQVPIWAIHPTSTPSIGAKSSLFVHQDVYGTGPGQLIVVVVSDVFVVSVTSHPVIVLVHDVLPQPVTADVIAPP